MAVLVGVYLLEYGVLQFDHGDRQRWTGIWTLLRSSSFDQSNWEALTIGQTSTSFYSREAALEAALEAGTEFARTLQSDPCLEPIRWPRSMQVSGPSSRWSLWH